MRCNIGLLHHKLKDDEAAHGELGEALTVARSIGHRRLEATALCNLGIVEESSGNYERAVERYAESVNTAQALSDPRLEGQFRGYWGVLLARLGRADESVECLEHGIRLLSDMQRSYKPGHDPLPTCYRRSAMWQRARVHCFNSSIAETILNGVQFADDSELGQISRKPVGLPAN